MMRIDYGAAKSKDSALRMSGQTIAGGAGMTMGMSNQSQDNF